MNKLFTKIAGVTLGFAMAIGVGVAVAGKQDVKAAKAADSYAVSYDYSGLNGKISGSFTTEKNYYKVPSAAGNTATVTLPFDQAYTPLGAITLTFKVACFGSGTNPSASNTTVTATGTDTSSSWTGTGLSAYPSSSTYVNATLTMANRSESLSGLAITMSVNTGVKIFRLQQIDISFSYSSGDTPVTYGVTYDANGATSGTVPTDSNEYADGDNVTVLGNTGNLAKTDYEFAGWNTKADGTGTTYTANQQFAIHDDTTLYVKWDFAGAAFDKITDLNLADKVVITSSKDNTNYYLPAATTSNAPAANTCAISNNQLTGVDSSNLFTVTKNSDGQFAFQNADGKYLKNINNNNGVRINETTATYWTVTATTNGFKMTNNSRWLGVYNTQDWRSYDSSTASNYGVSAEAICFYGIAKEITTLDSIELRDYPTTDLDIGTVAQLGYYGLDTDGEQWYGDVVYTTSNSSVVEVNASTGELRAVAAGTSNITVYANAGVNGAKVESDPITVTVLADPERIELPVGSYTVTIDAKDEASSTVPATRDYEIKAKEGRTWYQNLTAAFSGISVLTNYNEYESAKTTGALTITNNSNAVISSVEVHYYKYLNTGVGIYVGEGYTEMLEPTSSTGTSGSDDDLYRGYTNIEGNTFALKNTNGSYTSKFFSVTITLTVADESEEFLSLTINKGETATSFTEGDAPNHVGLTVYENYTTDGETISRSEDVTSAVTWDYSIEAIAADTTSYTVTATYGGHTTAPTTIDGFTVTILSKYSHVLSQDELFDGQVVILAVVGTNDKTAASMGNNILNVQDANIVNNKVQSNNEMEFVVRMYGDQFALERDGKFLNYSGSSNQVYLTEESLNSSATKCGWTLDDTGLHSEGGNRYLKYNASSPRFACYGDSTDYQVVQLYKSDASVMTSQNKADTFLYRELHLRDIATTDRTEGTACKGETGYYETAKAVFTAESFADARSYVLANEDAVARLSAWARANGEEFDSTNGTFTQNARGAFNSEDSNDVATIVVIIAIASISAFGCLLILKKRKHQ